MAAALAILTCVSSVLFFGRDSSPSVPRIDHGMAVLTRAIDAKWTEKVVRRGDSLAAGTWRLEEGKAELEFYSGASVILEAPVVLEIISDKRGRLLEGKLRAEVPHQAHGFTVITPEVELVDVGTSFGIEVESGEGTNVHVFEGEVELYRPEDSAPTRSGESLFAGDGRSIDPNGKTSEISAEEDRFLTRQEFDRIAGDRIRERIRRWQKSSERCRQDSGLIAYYDFQPGVSSGRRLTNGSPVDDPGLEGSIIGAAWVEGRWPGKSALDFKRPSDRVRINVPGVWDSVTLVAWIRIDAFDNKMNSLLLSDGWGRSGSMHWQIRNGSRVALAVRREARRGKVESSAPFQVDPADFGRWMQVALVYDSTSGQVSHYRDGEVIGTAGVDGSVPVEIGSAEIGNWTPSARKTREVRNFNGRIDELMIFGRVLSSDEIGGLYADGLP